MEGNSDDKTISEITFSYSSDNVDLEEENALLKKK